jgi:hypothetical protein
MATDYIQRADIGMDVTFSEKVNQKYSKENSKEYDKTLK